MTENPDQITMWDALRVWWAWIWRATVAGIGLGIAMGFVAGVIGVILGLQKEQIMSVLTPFSFIAGMAFGVWVLKYALNKKYGDFKLVLIRDKDI